MNEPVFCSVFLLQTLYFIVILGDRVLRYLLVLLLDFVYPLVLHRSGCFGAMFVEFSLSVFCSLIVDCI